MALAPGDIVFVGWDSDNDDIAFLTTTDLAAGEVIYFTDDEWDGTSFNGTEQYMEWTVPAGGVEAGAVVTIDMDRGARSATIDAGGGFDYMRGGYDIAGGNEMFWAFQGERVGNIAIPDTFIAVIGNEADGNDNQTPNLTNTGLTPQNGAFILDGDEDYMEWVDDANQPSPVTRDALLASVLDQTNWQTADGGGNNNPNGTGFDVETQNVVCFASGVMIETPDGERPVETLSVGDLVTTLDKGPLPIRWIGRRRFGPMTLSRNARLRPVVFETGSLGPNTPKRTLALSRQHRVMVSSKIAGRMFGAEQILVAAAKLTAAPGVSIAARSRGVAYHHILLDSHEVLLANGAPAESLWLGASARGAIGSEGMAEITEIFPELKRRREAVGAGLARPIAQSGRRTRKLIERHTRKERALVELAD